MNQSCRGCDGPLPPDAPADKPCRACAAELSYIASLSQSGTDAGPIAPGDIQLSDAFRARFEVRRVLGSGSMAAVLLARDRELGHDVALKFLTHLRSREHRLRFRNETKLNRRVDHPNVVRLHDAGQEGQNLYLVSEFVDGGALRDHMAPGKRLPPARALPIMIACLDGLQACHALGITHRDLKPENILLTLTGVAKVADLGLARAADQSGGLTDPGTIVGTPRYLSPEQCLGLEVGPPADIYACGVVLYEMLAGARPLDSHELQRMLSLHAFTVPPALSAKIHDLPEGLSDLVASALAKEPGARPRSAGEFAARLREIAQHPRRQSRPVVAGPRSTPVGPTARPWYTTRAVQYAAAATAALGLALGAAGVFSRPPDLADLSVIAGLHGARITWTSQEPYAGAAEVEGGPAGVSAPAEAQPTRSHDLVVRGLPAGASVMLRPMRGGRPLAGFVRVDVPQTPALPTTLSIGQIGQTAATVLLQLPIPFRVVRATARPPGIEVTPTPGMARLHSLALGGPGAPWGLGTVELELEAADGERTRATMTIHGAADALERYVTSRQLSKDAAALDALLSDTRTPRAARLQAAADFIGALPASTSVQALLPGLRAGLDAPALASTRRARVTGLLDELRIVPRLLAVRLGAPPAAHVALTPWQALDDLARGAPPAPPGEPHAIHRFPADRSVLSPRLRGESAAGRVEGNPLVRFVASGFLPDPPPPRIRLTLTGRCLGDTIFVDLDVNSRVRVRFFGETGSATTLSVTIPADALLPGDNTFTATASVLGAGLADAPGFCAPALFELSWSAAR